MYRREEGPTRRVHAAASPALKRVFPTPVFEPHMVTMGEVRGMLWDVSVVW